MQASGRPQSSDGSLRISDAEQEGQRASSAVDSEENRRGAADLKTLASLGADRASERESEPTESAASAEVASVAQSDNSTSQRQQTERLEDEAQRTVEKGPPGEGNDEVLLSTFPQRLLEILSNEEHADIISWLPHGKGFRIYAKKRFEDEVLPKYFKRSKFTSFTRKLNRWNFNRITRGQEAGAYYHDCFQRDKPELSLQMCCKIEKSSKISHFGGARAWNNALAAANISRIGVDNDVAALQKAAALQAAVQAALITGNNPLQPLLSGSIASQVRQFDDDNLVRLRFIQQVQQEQQRQQLAALTGLNLQQNLNLLPQLAMPLQPQLPNAILGASIPRLDNSSPLYSTPPVAASRSASIMQRAADDALLAMLVAQQKMEARMGTVGVDSNAAKKRQDNLSLQQAALQAQQEELRRHALNQQLRDQGVSTTDGDEARAIKNDTRGNTSPRGHVKRASAA